MEQIQTNSNQQTSTPTFRDMVDVAIVLGALPSLILSVILWAIATAFPQAGALPVILALLITLLLTGIGIIMLVRYVDICVINYQKSLADENAMMIVIGASCVCGFLVICVVGCLSVAGLLDPWHYALMGGEVLMVGYQTWRVFLGQQD